MNATPKYRRELRFLYVNAAFASIYLSILGILCFFQNDRGKMLPYISATQLSSSVDCRATSVWLTVLYTIRKLQKAQVLKR
jgi:hypothetical protein